MIVRTPSILLVPLLVSGCATQFPVALQTSPPVMIAAVSPTKFAESRYDVRGYREAANPSIRHEGHAIYRSTRVPITASDDLETVPRASYPPASLAPLPASDELAVELATQKKITMELRTMQTSMMETEQKMQAQYALLVRQSADALKLREQLEKERNRVRTIPSGESAPVMPVPAPGGSAEVKW